MRHGLARRKTADPMFQRLCRLPARQRPEPEWQGSVRWPFSADGFYHLGCLEV